MSISQEAIKVLETLASIHTLVATIPATPHAPATPLPNDAHAARQLETLRRRLIITQNLTK